MLPLFFLSCAYFNMYYNANESYKEAEKKRKETNTIDKGLYENSLKELSKILEFYPESRWVDDALLMMGLCYLRQEDYYKAQKKFYELVNKYPDSDLTDQAKIHWAEAEIGLKNFEEARKLISQIEKGNVKIEPYELLKLSAELSLSIGDSADALKMYMDASKAAASQLSKTSMLRLSAGLSELIGDNGTSVRLYKELADTESDRQKKLEAIIKYSEALEKTGNSQKAIETLKEFTAKEEFVQYSLAGLIKLARLYLNERSEKAYELLDEILRNNPKDRTNGPALSEAAFYFGEYYFDLKKDLNSAEDMYDSSGFYDRRNQYFQKASERIGLIRNVRNLKKKIESAPGQKDSLEAKIERLDRKSKAEQITPEVYKSLAGDLETAHTQLRSLKTSYVTEKMTLAELMYHELGSKDTALVLYRELASESSFPHKASIAMIRLIFSEDSLSTGLEDSLLAKYPFTAGANFVRSQRGIEPVLVIEDSARYLFNISSQKFLDSLYIDAFNEYSEIGTKFDKSPLAPKILNAAGLIAEKYLNDNEKAAQIYSVLKEKYPSTPQGRFADQKLAKEGETAPVRKEPEQKVSESEKWYLMDRRNQ
jgi:tetratricopeptide (TPR) repeat protein